LPQRPAAQRIAAQLLATQRNELPVVEDHPMNHETLPIDAMRTDGGTQPRAAVDPETVAAYAEAMTADAAFPPVTVFYDGQHYWLGDGFHRRAAAKQAGRTEIATDIRQGTRRDAILFSCGANAAHGLPRNNSDKRRATLQLLNDAKWSHWSDREIAKRCCVSHTYVAKLRMELSGNGCQIRTVSRGPSVYEMNVAAVGHLNGGTPPTPRPRLDVQSFADMAGIDIADEPEPAADVFREKLQRQTDTLMLRTPVPTPVVHPEFPDAMLDALAKRLVDRLDATEVRNLSHLVTAGLRGRLEVLLAIVTEPTPITPSGADPTEWMNLRDWCDTRATRPADKQFLANLGTRKFPTAVERVRLNSLADQLRD
jgi:hypothetical protein